jgi:hypothetical protein
MRGAVSPGRAIVGNAGAPRVLPVCERVVGRR